MSQESEPMGPHTTDQPANDRLDHVLADYMRRRDGGEDVNVESWCAAHPDLAEDLRRYASGEQLIAALAESCRDVEVESRLGLADDTARPGGARRTSLSPGVRFGRYRIVRLLGEGAMGAVYLAEDTHLERPVALKIPKFTGQEGPEFRERFAREARAAARLDHPHICRVYDADDVQGTPYITMAYVDGVPLSHLVGTAAYDDQRRVAEVVRGIAAGLAHAHENGILHRDLKPGNVLMRRGVPCVTDFGLARCVDVEDQSRLTHEGTVLGTPAYMAPEQIEGPLDGTGPASDIYALGVILYELLTKRLPFQGSVPSILGQALRDVPPPLSRFRRDVDPALAKLCRQMLEKSADRRPASMQDVIDTLNGFLKRTADKEPNLSKQTKPRLTIGKRSWKGLVVLLAACGMIGGAVMLTLRNGDRTITVQVADSLLATGPLTLSVDGAEYVLSGPDTKLVFSPGEHGISVRQGTTRIHDPCKLTIAWGEPQVLRIDRNGVRLADAAAVLEETGTLEQLGKSSHQPTELRHDDFPLDPQPGDRWQSDFPRIEFVWCPPGSFRMGSRRDPPPDENERPVDVTLTHGLWVARHEVTQLQWRAVIGTEPWKQFVDHQDSLRAAATHVTWYEATQFCKRLTDSERDAGVIPADWEFRLPTEAEWEYFCRAGTQTEYSFGNDATFLSEYAWWRANTDDVGERYAHDVGRLKPNPWGLHDVHGNVYEWVRDTYTKQLPGGIDPLEYDSDEERHVNRGGGWARRDEVACTSSNRRWSDGGDRWNNLGLRVVLARSVTDPVADSASAEATGTSLSGLKLFAGMRWSGRYTQQAPVADHDIVVELKELDGATWRGEFVSLQAKDHASGQTVKTGYRYACELTVTTPNAVVLRMTEVIDGGADSQVRDTTANWREQLSWDEARLSNTRMYIQPMAANDPPS